jgi:hypothetical protein
MARRSSEQSPYAPYAKPFAVLPSAGRPVGDPHSVAVAIVDATKEKQPRRRYVVGDDAEFWLGLHKRLSDEEFEQLFRSAVSFWE